MTESKRGPGWKRALTLLRLVLAVAILGWVATNLPWRDQLVYHLGKKEKIEVSGTIEGDWKSDVITFSVDEEAALPPGWPESVRTAQAGGVAFAVERRDTEDPEALGFSWNPSMPRVFSDLNPRGLAQAIGLFLIAMAVVITRWWRLLALAGCPTTWFNAFRLTFLGMFFNQVVPGLTGGDIVKGVIAAKENPGRRADALVSVVVDRALGLAALAVLAFVVIMFSGDTFSDLRLPLIGLLAAVGLGVLFYTNARLRSALRLKELILRLPFGKKLQSLDRAALLYLRHPAELALAFGLSMVNHLLVIFGVFCLGGAFGVDRSLVGLMEYLVLVPVANIVSALPLAPGGWGLGEWVYQFLFEMLGASGAMGVAISVTFRFCQLGLGLVGGVFMLLPKSKAEVRAAEEAA